MLFSEHSRDPSASLPSLSERISFSILRVGAALDVALDQLGSDEKQALWAMVQEQLPPSLFERYGQNDAYPTEGAEGAQERLPWPYQKSCISSGLSSRLVYREGLAFVEGLPDTTLSRFALTYLQQEPRVRLLARQVAASGLDFASDVSELLMRGGVRAATVIHSPVNSPVKRKGH